MLGHREHTGHSGPDPFDAEVWIIRIGEKSGLQRLHELAVDQPRRDIALGGQFVERPGDTGRAVEHAAPGTFALVLSIGGVERPAPVRRVKLPLRAHCDAGDGVPRGRFAEASGGKGLVTGRREQHTRDRKVVRSQRLTSPRAGRQPPVIRP